MQIRRLRWPKCDDVRQKYISVNVRAELLLTAMVAIILWPFCVICCGHYSDESI